MHRSTGRDTYEERIRSNPEAKATMLVASPYRKHQRQAAAMLDKVERAKRATEDAMERPNGDGIADV